MARLDFAPSAIADTREILSALVEKAGQPVAAAYFDRFSATFDRIATFPDSGYPILSHVQRLVDGEIVWAAGLDGGLVLSKRGGDFELTVGQDFSIGYLEHNLERVLLYIEESFTFLVLTDQAAIPLTTGSGKKG